MKGSLLQIINTEKLTKTACSSRIVVHYNIRKFLQFYKGYFLNFYQIKALNIKQFCKILEKFCNFSLISKSF